MRILGIEISKVPKRDSTVWHRVHGQPRRITDLTPDELRAELKWAHDQMYAGAKLVINNVWDRKINALRDNTNRNLGVK